MRIPFVTLLAAFGAMAPASAAFAQTDLHLNPGAPDACVFEVNQHGIVPYLSGSSGALQAGGAFADACAAGAPPIPPTVTAPVIRLWAPEAYTIGSGSLSLRWRASADATCTFVHPTGWTGPTTACTGRDQCLGDLEDPKTVLFSPPETLTPGNYDFGVKCEGNPQAKIRSVAVTAGSGGGQPGSEPSYCASSRPAGLTRLATGSLFFWGVGPGAGTQTNAPLTYFHHVFGRDRSVPSADGEPWPKFTNTQRSITQPRNQYIALEFTVPEGTFSGYGNTTFFQSGMSPGVQTGTISISQCHGDFGQYTQYPLHNSCKTVGSMGGMELWWEVESAGSGMCSLERGKTYYVNVRSDCTDATCRYSFANETGGIDQMDMGILLDIGALRDLGRDD